MGWVKLHRVLLEHPIWACSTAEQKVVFIALLLSANYTKNDWEWKGKPYTCNEGELITSYDAIAKKCGKDVTAKKVRTYLKKLIGHGVIKTESSNGGTLITFTKWEKHQGQVTEEQKADGWQKTGKQEATNKNNNKKNKSNNSYGVSKNKFINFEQRTYDYDLYEKLEFERISGRNNYVKNN